MEENSKFIDNNDYELEKRYQGFLKKSNDLRQTILEKSSRLEELGDFKVCLEASLGANPNHSHSSLSRHKKFLNDLDSAFISLG